MTEVQRNYLRQLVRSGPMWDALCEVFEDQAAHALEVQDEQIESQTENPDLSRIVFLTAERLTCIRMANRIIEESTKREEEKEPSEG